MVMQPPDLHACITAEECPTDAIGAGWMCEMLRWCDPLASTNARGVCDASHTSHTCHICHRHHHHTCGLLCGACPVTPRAVAATPFRLPRPDVYTQLSLFDRLCLQGSKLCDQHAQASCSLTSCQQHQGQIFCASLLASTSARSRLSSQPSSITRQCHYGHYCSSCST